MLALNKNKKYFNYFSRIILITLVINFLIFPISLAAEQSQSGGEMNAATINSQIEEKKDRIKELEEKIAEYQKNIDYQRSQSSSLASQIAILNNQIGKLETEIELKQNQIDQTKLEIKDTENKIQNTEIDIKKQKERLAVMLQQMNRLDQKTTVEIIFSVNSFSEYYNHLHTLSILQNDTGNLLGELKDFKANLEERQKELDEQKKSLENLVSELADKKSTLESRSYAKKSLLTESRNSEAKFKSLVAQLRAEQSAINADIIALEQQIRKKLGGQQRYESLGPSQFNWPVPSREITAYFHDSDYPFRYIFEHPAIDIKSKQGSAVMAASAGYVATARDAGMGYNYVMIIHGDGFSTVYGHLSRILVTEDEYVGAGDIIGLSGGMPGTPGAGRLTTGPHLHFEIRKNGIPVNPLDYLP